MSALGTAEGGLFLSYVDHLLTTPQESRLSDTLPQEII
jgi:hypothetical protein